MCVCVCLSLSSISICAIRYLLFSLFFTLFYFYDWSFNYSIPTLFSIFFSFLCMYKTGRNLDALNPLMCVQLSNCLALLLSVYSTTLSTQDQLHIWQLCFWCVCIASPSPPPFELCAFVPFSRCFTAQVMDDVFPLLWTTWHFQIAHIQSA